MWHFIIALAFSVNPTNLQEIPWGAADYPVFLVFAIWHKNCPLCKILIILWAYPVHSLSSMIDPVMVIIAVGLCSPNLHKIANPDYDSKPGSVTAGSLYLGDPANSKSWVSQPANAIYFFDPQLFKVCRKKWSQAKVFRCKQEMQSAWAFCYLCLYLPAPAFWRAIFCYLQERSSIQEFWNTTRVSLPSLVSQLSLLSLTFLGSPISKCSLFSLGSSKHLKGRSKLNSVSDLQDLLQKLLSLHTSCISWSTKSTLRSSGRRLCRLLCRKSLHPL